MTITAEIQMITLLMRRKGGTPARVVVRAMVDRVTAYTRQQSDLKLDVGVEAFQGCFFKLCLSIIDMMVGRAVWDARCEQEKHQYQGLNCPLYRPVPVPSHPATHQRSGSYGLIPLPL